MSKFTFFFAAIIFALPIIWFAISFVKSFASYSLFPKSLPKWVNSYDSESVQLFEIEFIVVDYKLEFN